MMSIELNLPEPHTLALQTLLRRVPPDEVTWVLTGSGSLRLQGVDVPVHDLDVQSNLAGVDEIVRRLPEAVRIQPAWSAGARIRSYFGTMERGGLKIELMGDIQRLLPDGSWSQVIDLVAYRRWISWQDLQVPVLDLAYEAQAYEELGRTEKAAAIRAVLRARGDR
jgi:hypothetical protein